MATEREVLTQVRDDLRRYIDGDHTPEALYYTLMLMEAQVSIYLRTTNDEEIDDYDDKETLP